MINTISQVLECIKTLNIKIDKILREIEELNDRLNQCVKTMGE
jgi:hypothetical protein